MRVGPRTLKRACLIAALLLTVACSNETDVSGLWEMPESSSTVLVEQLGEPFSGRVKMAIDQFGWDVAGVFLFYRDDIYYLLDSCHYVVDGEVRGDDLLFSLELDGDRRLLGTLEYEEVNGKVRLTGKLVDPDGVMPELPVSLERIGGDREVHREEWDFGCP